MYHCARIVRLWYVCPYHSEDVVLFVKGEIGARDEDLIDELALEVGGLHLLGRHVLALCRISVATALRRWCMRVGARACVRAVCGRECACVHTEGMVSAYLRQFEYVLQAIYNFDLVAVLLHNVSGAEPSVRSKCLDLRMSDLRLFEA